MKKKEIFLYFFIFITISLLLIINKYSVLAVNDDLMLQSMLMSKGVYGTLILSYPMSFLLSNLYDYLPSIQWYSLFLSTIMFLNIYFISIFISNFKDYITKVLLIILMTILTIYIWQHMSITSLTLLTMINALFYSQKNIITSLLLILLSILLRTDIALSLMPFVILGFFIINSNYKISHVQVFKILFIFLAIVTTILSPKINQQYSNWIEYNKARSNIHDLKGKTKHNILSEEQVRLIRGWWIQDSSIISTEDIIQASPSLGEILIYKLKNADLQPLLQHRYKFLLLFLIIFVLFLMAKHRKNKKVLLYFFFIMIFILLLLIRDKERVTVILLFMFSILMFIDIYKERVLSRFYLFFCSLLFIYYFYPTFNNKSLKDVDQLKVEAKLLINKNNIQVEPSIHFPTSWSLTGTLLSNNILFNEKSWIQLNANGILPIGWPSRHPYFYSTHNIGHKKKYENYYQYLLDSKTGFIGGKPVSTNLYAKTILNLYDKKYLKDKPACQHAVDIIDSSKHYLITQVNIHCKKDNNDSIQ